MEIKTADANDAKEIAKINVATWKVAYKDLLPEAYLAQRTADDKRVEGVRASIESGVGIWIKALITARLSGIWSGEKREMKTLVLSMRFMPFMFCTNIGEKEPAELCLMLLRKK